MNSYEIDSKNVWDLDYSDSRTFATGFYNAIKQGHESDDYVTFKYFTKDSENSNVHAKKYFKQSVF